MSPRVGLWFLHSNNTSKIAVLCYNVTSLHRHTAYNLLTKTMPASQLLTICHVTCNNVTYAIHRITLSHLLSLYSISLTIAEDI